MRKSVFTFLNEEEKQLALDAMKVADVDKLSAWCRICIKSHSKKVLHEHKKQ